MVITASPELDWADALANLQKRGVRANVVLFDPASFGGSWTTDEVRARLLAGGARTFVVKRGASIPAALSDPEVLGPRLANGRKPMLVPVR